MAQQQAEWDPHLVTKFIGNGLFALGGDALVYALLKNSRSETKKSDIDNARANLPDKTDRVQYDESEIIAWIKGLSWDQRRALEKKHDQSTLIKIFLKPLLERNTYVPKSIKQTIEDILSPISAYLSAGAQETQPQVENKHRPVMKKWWWLLPTVCIVVLLVATLCAHLHRPLEVETRMVSGVTANAAKLEGYINSHGRPLTSTRIEFGENPVFMDSREPKHGQDPQIYTVTVTNLKPNTTYYFRVVAQSENTAVYGKIKTFTTPPEQ